ncbi:MAG: YibE/F family protein [Parcubacteria group bacterium]
MKKITKKIILVIFVFITLLPLSSKAQVNNQVSEESIFKAEVVEILDEELLEFNNESSQLQQNLKLLGLEGEYENETIVFEGIGDLEVLSAQTYEVGDKVLMAHSQAANGQDFYYIVEPYRTASIWYLLALFVAILLIVGRWKGFRSLIVLSFTFFIIISYIIPKILAGANPLMVTILGSLLILLVIIYVTEGIKVKSHLAVASIFFSLVITIFISWLFVNLAQLTGAASEDILFLFNIEGATINLKGLLLAGIIIGALGVLDDAVISQISTAKEIASSNLSYRFKEIFVKTYRVGVSHIASMTNTLFLAYAGVSLPLLILFISGESPFNSIEHIINTELIATEIIRTLSGTIGLIFSVPVATFLAAWYYGKENESKDK